MLVVRDIMYCKPGKVRPMVDKFLAMSKLGQKIGLPPMKVMTDFSAERYWTIVAEMEVPSMKAFEDMMSGAAHSADDMKQFFGLLHPSFATGLSKMLQEKRIPQTEREESWQSVWTLKTAELDKRDPYIVRVVGQQELTKTLEGAVKRETKLIQVEVKLAADKRGRADENLRTGFVPIGMQEKVLSAQPQ